MALTKTSPIASKIKELPDELQKKPATGAASTAPAATTPTPTTPPITEPTVSQMAGAQGMPAAPVTPMGTASMAGATPQQVAMAGTPAQTGASGAGVPSPTASGKGQTDLARADRAAELGKAQMDQAEAQRQQRRQEMRTAYGDVGLGVDNMIQAALNQSKNQSFGGLQTGYSVAEDKLGQLPQWAALDDFNKTNIIQAAQSLAENINDPQAMANVQSMLDQAGIKGLTPQQIKDQVLNQKTTEKATAEQVADSVKLDTATLESFGVSADDLAMIGLTPEQVEGMSLKDFQAKLNDAVKSEFARADSIRAQLSDPNLPADVRKQLQDELRQLGASGGYQSTAELKQVEQEQIADEGDTIDIGGQAMTVDQLLGDEGMTGVISGALASEEQMKALKKQFPQLAEFIEKNKGTLEKAAAQLSGTAETVFEIQENNKQIRQAIESSGVSATDAAAILGDIYSQDQFSVSRMDPSQSGIMQMLVDPKAYGLDQVDPATGKPRLAQTVANIKQGIQEVPGLKNDLARLSPNELKTTGIMENSQKWKDFTVSHKQNQAIESGDLDAIAKQVFGSSNLQQALDNAILAGGVSGRPAGQITTFLDRDGDGKLDDPATIQSRLKEMVGKGSTSLQQLVAGGIPRPVNTALDPKQKEAAALFTTPKFKSALSDGTISPQDIDATPWTNQEMQKLISGLGSRVTPEARKTIAAKVKANSEAASTKLIREAHSPEIVNGRETPRSIVVHKTKLEKALAEAKKNPYDYDMPMLEAELKKIDEQYFRNTKPISARNRSEQIADAEMELEFARKNGYFLSAADQRKRGK